MTVRSVAEARLLEDREQRKRRLNEEKLKKIEYDINGRYFFRILVVDYFEELNPLRSFESLEYFSNYQCKFEKSFEYSLQFTLYRYFKDCIITCIID